MFKNKIYHFLDTVYILLQYILIAAFMLLCSRHHTVAFTTDGVAWSVCLSVCW